MNNIAIVVEGRNDVFILRNLLEGIIPAPRFFVANGKASTLTVARNILFHENIAVLVVADADTRSQDEAEGQQSKMLEVLRSVAPQGRADVFLFRPELECIFFETSAFQAAYPDLHYSQLKAGSESKRIERELVIAAARPFTLAEWVKSLPKSSWGEARVGAQASAFIRAAVALCQDDTEVS